MLGKIKCAVFDLGGTLMEYAGMPYVWYDYYEKAFRELNDALRLGLSDEQLTESVEIMKSYNPGINYREKDFPPEVIFKDVTKNWQNCPPLDTVIDAFFHTFNLKAVIYPESIDVLKKLRACGLITAAYTNVVSGMPDEMHRAYCKELLPYFDMYVSSVSCGYRKPDPKGLEIIAEKFCLTPDEMIFSGDEKKDPETARRFGCLSVLINRSGETRNYAQNFTLSDLNGLPALIFD